MVSKIGYLEIFNEMKDNAKEYEKWTQGKMKLFVRFLSDTCDYIIDH